jgi:multicomponent Na+:H+ antiporter subunit F
MNGWLIGAAVLMIALVPCGIACVRQRPIDAVVALEAGIGIGALALLLLAIGAHRSPYADVALLVAALDLGGGLIFARFLDRLG